MKSVELKSNVNRVLRNAGLSNRVTKIFPDSSFRLSLNFNDTLSQDDKRVLGIQFPSLILSDSTATFRTLIIN